MAEHFNIDTLNTSYVNLAAFIRYLRENNFHGRLHVELDQYEGDIFLYGADNPSAWEIDRTTGREEQGDDAMQRLLVRSREPGGVIRIFPSEEKTESVVVEEPEEEVVVETGPETETIEVAADGLSPVAAASELLHSVERVTQGAGANFDEELYAARVELGDDYPFLDPTSGSFEFKEGTLVFDADALPATFVQGVSNVLRKVIDSVARKNDGDHFRELIATELAVTAQRSGFGDFTSQLDRIAGTRVL